MEKDRDELRGSEEILNEKDTGGDDAEPREEEKDFTLSKKMIKDILYLISFTVLLYWGVTHLELLKNAVLKILSVVSPLLVGFCIAFIVNVLLNTIEEIWDKIFKKAKAKVLPKLKRPVCLVLSYILLFGAVFAVIFMILPEIAQTINSMLTLIPQFLAKTEDLWNSVAGILDSYNIVMPAFDIDIKGVVSTIEKIVNNYGESFLNTTIDITSSIISLAVNFVLSLVISIYVLAQKEKLGTQVKKSLYALMHKRKAEKVSELARFTSDTFSKFVTGQLTEAVIIGLLCFIGMLIFRMPYAGAVSVLVGFTALIPVFGAFIGTGVGAFLILISSPVKALWFIVFIIVLQQLEGNLIYPKVVGKSVGLPGIWVIAAVTLGGNAFGLLGMIFSVPVCSVLYTMFREYVYKRLKEKKMNI